ncbi:MAG: cyclic nucleotide-binding domain-containing protein [Gammaproteobacteria bacterium]|nr:cyclic nucleotide-binding domain-containing protein [Gammaproteobacteria bacterium]
MSEQADSGGLPEGSTIAVAFLQQVPLFAELTADELHDLVAVMEPIELAPGQLLWRQGQAADALHLISGGRIGIYLRQPGGTEVHLTTLGPGEVIGELPLIAGGTRSATARVLERARLWSLSRVDFAALTLRRSPTALALRRGICAVACTRLRDRYQQLANSLPPDVPPGASEPPTAAELTESAPPDDYLSNLAFFRDFAADHLRSLVERSQLFMIPRRRVLEHEGDAPRGCYVTLNGAVEMTIERGRHRIPIGLAGPGRAFSYVGLIDGKTAPVTVRTRELSLLLRIAPEPFAGYFHGATAESHALFNAIERDLMGALRRNDLGFVRAVGTASIRTSAMAPQPRAP